MCILFFLPLRSIPIQSRVENIVTAFCHDYSTRLSLLLLPRLRISFSMLLCTTCLPIYIHSIYIFFSSRSIPIQSTENSTIVENIVTAFVAHHFCHNYSTRSLLLSLLLLLLPRFERNILFHATLYYVFIYIPSLYPLYIYILFFSPFDPNSIDREFDDC